MTCTLSVWHDGQELCADVSKITEAERKAVKAVLAPRIPAAMALLRQAVEAQAMREALEADLQTSRVSSYCETKP